MRRVGMVVGALLVVMGLALPQVAAQSRVRGFPDYGVVSVTRPGVTPRDDRVYQRLETGLISFTFNEQPLAQAIDFLATVGNVNIVLDRSKADGAATVTLKLRDVSLRTALDFVTEQAELKWVVKGGVVFVSDEEGTTLKPVTVVYDVRHLLHRPPDFEGPEIELGSLARSGSEDDQPTWPEPEDDPEKEQEKTREELMDELVQLIREVIAPGSWDDVD